jgi:hypothetical protein
MRASEISASSRLRLSKRLPFTARSSTNLTDARDPSS